ncbi:hypothetical protein RUM44_008245 [Polyplax serrata]|uniref:Major facilitator superfamily (MFS) profile domain-containing protein n=1 Tax=Polyplax serrata TaxID=468196 RepID=A0ABR1B7W5_POLSC
MTLKDHENGENNVKNGRSNGDVVSYQKETEPLPGLQTTVRCITECNLKPSKEANGNKIEAKRKCSNSLCRFEVNEYTIGDVRKLHERLVKHQKKTSKGKLAFFKDFNKKQKIVLACLCLVELMSFCSMSIMAPFFPKEALNHGMSETTAGLVFSFYALVIFLSSPFLASSSRGKVPLSFRPVFNEQLQFFVWGHIPKAVVSQRRGGVANLLGYIEQDWVFATYCFIVQGMKALGASAYSTASYVFVAEVFPSNIGTVLGIMETFVGLGMSIGPAIGGFFYHVGGFGLPFYILAAVLLLTFPIAFWLLPMTHGNNMKRKSGSFFKILKEPSVIVIGLVLVANSSVWGFLDPTLEPHLRQFGLTSEKIGFIFLLFSGLYGLSSPLWGVVSDKTDNHWSMMTSGLLFDTVGLLILGPATFIPFLKSELWLNLVALSILGVSVALSLLPTFQGLISSIVDGGHGRNDITTYSIVSGVWSSLYALGEVIGPLVGGLVTEHYGFAFCCTVLAGTTFTLAVVSCVFFIGRDCLNKRDRNCRYSLQVDADSDNDSAISSDEMSAQPILQSRRSS